jgi:hypothetical protein
MVHLCLKEEAQPLPKCHAFLKNKTMDEVPPKKIMSIDFSLFPLLFTNDNLVRQALVWLCKMRCGVVQFGASYANLRPPHIFKSQIK